MDRSAVEGRESCIKIIRDGEERPGDGDVAS